MIAHSSLGLKTSIINQLKNIRIHFVFQPIYDLKTEEIVAYEALMRPEGETPLELIDRYEAKRQLHLIELATFFGATIAYYERGYQELLSVNSFPSEAFYPDESEIYFDYFPSDIKEKLIVEILEYPHFSPTYWNLKRQQIKNNDIKIALDDFGSGYNDYSSLSLIEPNFLKLDRCLISDIHTSPKKQKRLEEILKVAHSLNIKVLAEGIETKDEYDYIQKSGTELAQGFYLGRPM
ncbi:MAG: EAL domain-containing protein [Lachnospiraceae bacterium]|nr:EAL domain-containing protein [Lachnospiraceae bacterium]